MSYEDMSQCKTVDVEINCEKEVIIRNIQLSLSCRYPTRIPEKMDQGYEHYTLKMTSFHLISVIEETLERW